MKEPLVDITFSIHEHDIVANIIPKPETKLKPTCEVVHIVSAIPADCMAYIDQIERNKDEQK